jgi:hypothetical protein
MRRAILLGFLLLPFTSTLLQAAEKPLRRTPIGSPLSAEGFGATAEEARKNALRNLADQLEQEQGQWLDPRLIERYGLLVVGNAEPSPRLLDQPLLQVRVTFTLTRELLEANVDAQRDQRARERQWWLARGIAALVLVFAVVAGYLQLEEWTRGFATRWLRGLAILILLVGGLLLWWVR